GVDVEQSRVETIVDRVNTTATVWLGSTLGCAQCHTHKYDPFTLKEYYQLFAFFNNADEPEMPVPTPDQETQREKLKQQTAQLEAELKKETAELAAGQAAWEEKENAARTDWVVLDPDGFASAGGASLTKLADKSVLAGGKNPSNDVYTVTALTSLQNITGL